MKRTRSVRSLGCLVAILLLSAGAGRAEVNRWDPVGPPPSRDQVPPPSAER